MENTHNYDDEFKDIQKAQYLTRDQAETMRTAVEAWEEAKRQLAEMLAPALVNVAAAAGEMARQLAPAVKVFSETLKDTFEIILEQYPNKRVLYLAKHAKKARVRKKNINRIVEWYARGGH